MNNLVPRAAAFARERHEGQLRWYTGEPYFVHLEEVAELLRAVGMDEHVVAAGYLHDTIEDTDTTLEELVKTFNVETAHLVWWVTDQSRPEHGNRATRKKIDREHVAHGPPLAHSVKVADLISNTRTIVQYDPGFAKIYLHEKALLLPLLDGAHPDLLRQAYNQLRKEHVI